MANIRFSNTFKADMVLLVVTFLAAAGWLFSKEALAEMPPLLFIGIRFLLAGATLFAVGHASVRLLSWADWWISLRVGALFGVAIMFWVSGLFHGAHLGEGAFITSLGVVLVPVAAALFFNEKPAASTWWALPIAILGLACLSLNHGLRLEPSQLLYVTAACLFSIQFNFNTLVVARVPAIVLTAIQLSMVGGLSLITSCVFETWPQQVSVSIWGWFFASVWIATSLRFFLQTYAQGLASASHAAVIMILEPVWTSLIGLYWYGQGMNTLQIVGCGLIFTALLINRWRLIRALLKGGHS